MPREPKTRRRGAAKGRAQAGMAAGDAPLARGVWSGSISFGLVTIAVELFSATRRNRVAMRMLGPDGTPLARQYICSRDERPLRDDEIERGFELDDGKFVVVSDAELEKLAPRRSRDIELTRFVERGSIDPAHFERAYFVLPGADQTKAYRLLADVMESTGRAAIAHFVMGGKAYAVAIFADRGILRAETLRFGDELRQPEKLGITAASKPDAARVTQMKRAIAKLKQTELDERDLADGEAASLLELAREKFERGKDVVRAPEVPAEEAPVEESEEREPGGELIDLFALIQQRLRDAPARPPSRATRTAARAPSPRRTGRGRAPPRRA